jgi:hypothetical protein
MTSYSNLNTDDSTGNLPSMPGSFSDHPAPIVRNFDGNRELTLALWSIPSSQLALMQAAKKRSDAGGEGQTGRFPGTAGCCNARSVNAL